MAPNETAAVKESDLDARAGEERAASQLHASQGWRRIDPNLGVIALATLLVHGLLLLNDGVYWDGWVIYAFLKFGNHDRLYEWFAESGALPVYYIHRVMGLFPGVIFGYKFVAFFLILSSAMLVYAIGRELKLLHKSECLWVAILSLCYPAFQVSIELVVLPFLIFYFLFLVGTFLALRAETGGKRFTAFSIMACICFFCSFFIGSLLSFYVGFLLLLVLAVRRRMDWPAVWRTLLPRRLHYVFLPLIFLVVKRQFLAPYGSYADYNELKMSGLSLVYSLRTYVEAALSDQFNSAFNATGQPFQWLLLFFFIHILWRSRSFAALRQMEAGSGTKLLGYGVVLFLLGMIPYVAVGKPPAAFGYDTRNSLLVGLPMAVILTGLARWLFVRRGRLEYGGWILLSGLTILFAFSTWRYYAAWQARSIKYASLMAKLRETPGAAGYSVFYVHDDFPTGGQELYSFQELSSMFRFVWGGEDHIGLDSRRPYWAHALERHPEFFRPPMSRRYNLSDCNPTGPRADLTIRRGRGVTSSSQLIGTYYLNKFFRRSRMDSFLSGVIDISIVPRAKTSAAISDKPGINENEVND